MTIVPRQPRTRVRGQLPVSKPKVEYGSLHALSGGGVSLVVFGRPAPQGSKAPVSGVEANPRTRPWRATIKRICEEQLPAGWVPLDGPLMVDFWFFFDPPKSAKHGDMPCTKTTFDWDKLSRAMGDGLVDGRVIVDDARVVEGTVHKRFVWPGEGEARAVVLVAPFNPFKSSP